MNPERWQRVKEALDAAIEKPKAERAEFLEEICGADEELKGEIESLLEFKTIEHECFEDGGFPLEHFAAIEESSLVGKEVGKYRIAGEIGAGGMGAVFLAERADGEFAQQAAIKFLRQAFSTAAARRKFLQERQILARLRHPFIAQLFDGGTTDDGTPFLVMEYVEGLPIHRYAETSDLSLEARIDLFRKVCEAVSFAHRNLIVHRDLKPDNILVTKEGTPKLLDFGIAKLLSENEIKATVTRLQALTPEYASPEQLSGGAITTASDVYALGIILYELLTGVHPFRGKNLTAEEILKAVSQSEPARPSAITNRKSEITNSKPKVQNSKTGEQNPKSQIPNPKSLRGDLDNIILKALRREPERRYKSVEQFSDDLKLYLNGFPVSARADSFSYRAAKFFGRNKFAVAAVALIFTLLVGGLVGVYSQKRIADAERIKAEQRFKDVRGLSTSFLFEFHDAIENLPGSTPARKLVIDRGIEYLDKLADEAGAEDASLQFELAESYRKLGEIQGHPSFPNIGDVAGGIKSFQKAVSIGENLIRNHPKENKYSLRLAYFYDMLGDMYNRGAYDTPAALENYNKSLVLRERLYQTDPNNVDHQQGLVNSYERTAEINLKTGNFANAENLYLKSLELSEKNYAHDPKERQHWRALYLSYSDLGEFYASQGNYEAAIVNLRKAVEFTEKIISEVPNDNDPPRTLAYFYDHLAQVYLKLDNLTEAENYARQGLAVRERLFAADRTNIQVYGDLTVSLDTVGDIESRKGNFAQSVELLRRSLEMREAALRQNPSMTIARRFAAISRHLIGTDLLRQNKPQAALEEFRKAIEATSDLSLKDASNLDFKRELAKFHVGQAEALERLKNETEACRSLDAALAIWHEMQKENKFFGADKQLLEKTELAAARCAAR